MPAERGRGNCRLSIWPAKGTASEGVHSLLQGLQKAQVKSNGLVIITNFTAGFSASSLLQECTEHPH